MFGWKGFNDHILWRSDEAEIFTGGKNTAKWAASGVAIKKADIQPGDVFFAAQGDNLNAVYQKGAAACIIPANMTAHPKMPCLQVANTFEALRQFARAARFKTHACVIAVQGECERTRIIRELSEFSDIYTAGSHFSCSLAALPDDKTYAVFGFVPSVMPSIAVVTDPAKALNSKMFQNMEAGGVIIIDDQAFKAAECTAYIRSCAHHHVYSIADIRANPKIVQEKTKRIAALAIIEALHENIATLETDYYAALKVQNRIDLGPSQTVILDSIVLKHQQNSRDDFKMPKAIQETNLVYTSKKLYFTPSPQKLEFARMQDIAPDVLVPGDVIVLKKPARQEKLEFLKALRSAA